MMATAVVSFQVCKFSPKLRGRPKLLLPWFLLANQKINSALARIQWFFWGYSLAFSHTAGSYIGNLDNIGFRNVLGRPSIGNAHIPDLLFAIYQGMFSSITYVRTGSN